MARNMDRRRKGLSAEWGSQGVMALCLVKFRCMAKRSRRVEGLRSEGGSVRAPILWPWRHCGEEGRRDGERLKWLASFFRCKGLRSSR
jgi:hypothetical protein